jgi:hypothetical protein
MFGLFGEKGTCSICGKEKTSKKLSDGFVCSKCLDLCGNNRNTFKKLQDTTTNEILEEIEKERQANLDITNFVGTRGVGKLIKFDDNAKKILFPKTLLTKARIYDYSELLGYEILEDGNTITKGGLGSAVVGGALFGGIGAVVGGLTGGKKSKEVVKSLKVKIVLDNKVVPAEYIELLKTEFKKDGFVYRAAKQEAEDIIAILTSISAENEKNQINNSNTQNTNDPIIEVKRYKELLDNGIITQEEFDKKKKELLNL